jgi:outer membrane lipoprotein-sorting protein
MKKFSLLLIMILTCSVGWAQRDENALTILDAMSSKYKKIPSYSADITSSLINETDGINEEFGGKITVKGDKYKLELDDQVVINNGETSWTYLPDVNEVNIDTYNPDEDEISPSKIYEAYKKGYKYIYIGDQNIDGKPHAVIDLVPDNKDAQYFKIKLFIKKADNALTQWVMYDKSGNQYKYTIKNFNSSINPSDAFFVFDTSKYPDVEVIDLR